METDPWKNLSVRLYRYALSMYNPRYILLTNPLTCFSSLAIRSCASVQGTPLIRTPWPFRMDWPSTGRRCTTLASARSPTWCSLLPTSCCPSRWMTRRQASSVPSVSSREVGKLGAECWAFSKGRVGEGLSQTHLYLSHSPFLHPVRWTS